MLIDIHRQTSASLVTADGVLDSSTYRCVRDSVIKAALEQPRAVVVDVNRLSVPSPSAWSVFASARWHVSTWPNTPILLACNDVVCRRAIASSGVNRYVPVHSSREAALEAADALASTSRRVARWELPRSRASIRLARVRIQEWLTTWSQRHLIPVAGTVATVFVENVLEHTDSAPVLILENCQNLLTVAVQDCSPHPPTRLEDAGRGLDTVSGLAIASVLCRSWGSTPTSSGKTVWAVLGSENQL
ncbi:sulfate transporter [Mycobacterium asiaticum]|uniref:Sulfate transporter n=1 Tax=Mycobacterium asiaticum TaxID=1790 RepID=A0A1A3MQN7_MYCAS|nr:STAS domain-containing protein [Mycobacterium asiaticum]OBK11089.1 sulfate transporter [Mycobacterium asiaticum]